MKDVVADLHLGVKELAAEDRSGWMPLALSDRLRDVVGVNEAVQVELIRTLAGWDRHCAWAEDGAVTAVSWLKHQLGMAPGEAVGLIHLARFYDEHRAVADALDGGHLRVAAARILLRASRRREEVFASCVEGLVELGATLPFGDFSQVMAEWIDMVDEQAPADDANRRFSSSDVGEQGVTEIVGSTDDAAVIRAAIQAHDTLDPADCPEGPRSREQRHYDIALDIFRRALADKLGQEPGSIGGVDIILDADTAAEVVAEHVDGGLLGDHDPCATDAEPAVVDPLVELLRPYREADIEAIHRRSVRYADGRNARRVVAAVLLCSGWVRRIIRDPRTGNVLDVGRAQRRYTKRQIRALVVRDGGCVFPGCDRKPKWCDAHHLKPWEDDGPTDLDNGCLLCRRHHTLVHHGQWRLERDRSTGVFTATAPDGRTFTRRPGERC